MKKSLLLLFLLLLFAPAGAAESRPREVVEAEQVIRRTFGRLPEELRLVLTAPDASGCDGYAVSVDDGLLRIEGSSCVALCRGFYDYILSHGYGVANWSGNRLELPDRLPDMKRRETRSPFRHHLYMNVCTFGYTTPFWDWKRWEQELDWMALHGFDMPLAPVATEAILARVWRKMGLTQEEIDAYFTGPAHMPWMRMGNMTGLDGAPSQEWHERQIELQHRILERMRALGMKPVFQGFAGFVPDGMRRLYPDLALTRTRWSGFESNLLSPLDTRFVEIGAAFVREWEREFGPGKYYLVDCFNELDVPFGKKGSDERAETLRRYARTVYSSLSEANPDAVWMMQGWMFGYQRTIWDPHSVEALLSGVPDGRLCIIDLAVDFNDYVWRSERSWDYYSGLYGKEWIYSTVPNFGGRSALTGVLDFYANGHLGALASRNRGELVGYGTSPEGVENNEAIYEVISAAGWSSRRIDVLRLLHDYSRARYGKSVRGVDRFWRGMLGSAYGEFTNNARFRWQLRPLSRRMATMGVNEHYFEAIEEFLGAAPELGEAPNYRTDAIQYAAFYLAGKADILLDAAVWAAMHGETEQAARCERRFLALLREADRLLASHPLLRLERWNEQARAAGCSEEERDRFVREQRRLISVWGGPSLSDYSARIWSGPIRDFYIPRWRNFFAALNEGRSFDFRSWDEGWHQTDTLSRVKPFAEPLTAACKLVEATRDISPEMVQRPERAVCCWLPFDFAQERTRVSFTIGHEEFRRMRGLRFTTLRGSEPVTLEKLRITASRHCWAEQEPALRIEPGSDGVTLRVEKRDVEAPLAKEFTVTLTLHGRPAADNYTAVELLY